MKKSRRRERASYHGEIPLGNLLKRDPLIMLLLGKHDLWSILEGIQLKTECMRGISPGPVGEEKIAADVARESVSNTWHSVIYSPPVSISQMRGRLGREIWPVPIRILMI